MPGRTCHADEDPLGRLPDLGDVVASQVLEEGLVGLVSEEAQSELAERHEVLGLEEVGERLGNLLAG